MTALHLAADLLGIVAGTAVAGGVLALAELVARPYWYVGRHRAP